MESDDLTATRRCAEALGVVVNMRPIRGTIMRYWFMDGDVEREYNPLHDDAQAMALVKRFKLICKWWDEMPNATGFWQVYSRDLSFPNSNWPELNGAIVYCVAAMQEAKNG